MIRRYRLLFIVATNLLLTLLAGCGQNYSTTGAQPSTPTPTATTGAQSPSPTTTGKTGPVTLHVPAASYHSNDTIEVILRNTGTSTITFPDHLTNCTVIQLQRQVNGTWETVNKCLLMIATRWHTLDAGQSLTVKLVPSPNRPWVVGLYQATLSYSISHPSGSLTQVFSERFQVT